ncbi:MAG TPA: glutamine synthetase type III, partial [Pirellulaceae bacterium]|nr:glutamine synthetase type III [Pirellulaceae bacterium]
NWSLGNSTQGNLLEPGETPHDNMQFLVFCAAVIRAVHKYGNLLRAVVATPNNDHRLGANEAPPAILSIFLGDQLTDVFEQLKAGGAKTSKSAGQLTVGVDTLPPLPKHAGDRNRTSPFAFTGNKFEFRAVGSSQSLAGPLVAMNTIMAESLDYLAGEIEKASGGDASKLTAAVQKVLQEVITKHGPIIFNGDNYTPEWHAEAEKRGLPNLRTAVDALPELTNSDVVALFEKYGVLSARELQSRQDIYLEQYVKTILTEAKLMVEVARTLIFPAAVRYQNDLATTCTNLKQLGYTFDTDTLDEVTRLVKGIQDGATACEKSLGHHGGGPLDEARHCRDQILPAMAKIREAADRLEHFVADDLWPLPTYQEMLFIK